jgi:hypothetical protein
MVGTENLTEGNKITLVFDSTVHTNRTEEVIVKDSSPNIGELYVATKRTNGPHFYIHSDNSVTLYSPNAETRIDDFGKTVL